MAQVGDERQDSAPEPATVEGGHDDDLGQEEDLEKGPSFFDWLFRRSNGPSESEAAEEEVQDTSGSNDSGETARLEEPAPDGSPQEVEDEPVAGPSIFARLFRRSNGPSESEAPEEEYDESSSYDDSAETVRLEGPGPGPERVDDSVEQEPDLEPAGAPSFFARLFRRSNGPSESEAPEEEYDESSGQHEIGEATALEEPAPRPEYVDDGPEHEPDEEPVGVPSFFARLFRRGGPREEELSEEEEWTQPPASIDVPADEEAVYGEAGTDQAYEEEPPAGRFAALTRLFRRSGSEDVEQAWAEDGEPALEDTERGSVLDRVKQAVGSLSARFGGESGRSLDWQTIRTAVKEAVRPPTITLSFEGDTVRLVVLNGREVVAWGIADLPPETVATDADQDGAEGGEDDHAAADEEASEDDQEPESARAGPLRELLDAHGVRGGNVIADIPLYASLLRHLKLPDIPKRYLKQVITSEIVETIPFSEDEVAISWQQRKDQEGEESVFAIAVPSDTVDSHAEMLDQAGARPKAAYSKAVALSYAAGMPDAIVVDVKASDAAVVLVRDETPQVVHQLTLPDGDVPAPQLAEEIAGGVEQMAAFYQDYQAFEAAEASSALPVVLTGDRPDNVEVSDALRRVMRRDVVACAPDLDYPDFFSPDEYAVNLGLALASKAKANAGMFAQGDPAINLLPERFLPKPLPVIPISVFALIFVLGVTAVVATTSVSDVEAEAKELKDDVERNAGKFEAGERVTKKAHEESQIAAGFADKLQNRVTIVREDIADLIARLDVLVNSARPEGLSVPSIAPKGDEFLVAGAATTYEDVLLYAENIRNSGLFSEVIVEGVQGEGIAGTAGTAQAGVQRTQLDFQIKSVVPPRVQEEEEDGELLIVP